MMHEIRIRDIRCQDCYGALTRSRAAEGTAESEAQPNGSARRISSGCAIYHGDASVIWKRLAYPFSRMLIDTPRTYLLNRSAGKSVLRR